MNNFQETLMKYADLAVCVGINIQKNQTLVVNSPIECAEFARAISESAYKHGARNVIIKWNDEKASLIKFLNAPEEVFNEFSKFEADELEDLAKNNAAFLSIYAQDPEILKPVEPSRIASASKARSLATKAFREYTMSSTVAWNVVSVPTEAWAKKVFPEVSPKEAVEKLWEAIFKIVRVDKNNPVAAWNEHLKTLEKSTAFLNEKKFKKLHYKSSITNLTVELPENHIWSGGGEYNGKNTFFVANMPTEEVFTLPLKTGVNGTVTSTKPLNYGGNLINDFALTFKDGKVVDFTAKEGYETLKKLLDTDEGARYLGEVALVPFDSPISNSNTVFYNTLFDENASCHLAFGNGYPTCLENGTEMSEEEFKNAGGNTSLTHVDFMIGSSDLDIIGITNEDEEFYIFKNGNWAF
ncbi:aminopeptidase [Clostridium sp. ATCC 25772]|uniref:aminopeptidase n=1 Tax=Clostridium sp. ATCC 25772 TaxID=1676991 RepID=UPI000783D38D|nr:aminopeptidase [Clostridium sp. ATCC 25772]